MLSLGVFDDSLFPCSPPSLFKVACFALRSTRMRISVSYVLCTLCLGSFLCFWGPLPIPIIFLDAQAISKRPTKNEAFPVPCPSLTRRPLVTPDSPKLSPPLFCGCASFGFLAWPLFCHPSFFMPPFSIGRLSFFFIQGFIASRTILCASLRSASCFSKDMCNRPLNQ